jgi:hypothetical protein
VAIVVTDVHRDGRGEEWMRSALNGLAKSPADGLGGPALLLPVAASSFREAGTYTVDVEATAPGRVLQRLQLRLTRPSAVLNASPVQLRHEIPLGGSRGSWEGSLLIAERSGATGINDITAAAPLFAGRHGATLRFRDGAAGVAPGTAARIPFSVDGVLPLGTTTGTIRLSSPQLAAPLDVPITITIYRSHKLLICVIVAGLLLGWLVRTYLTRRIERNRLRVQADDVLLRMEDAIVAHADPIFQSAVRALADPLRVARDRGKSESLTTAITTADTRLRTALEALQMRLDRARERTMVLARLVRTDWSLPVGLALSIGHAREAQSLAEGALATGDAHEADRLLDAAEEGLRNAFDDALSTWPIERTAVLEALAALPPEVREKAQPWIDAIRTDTEALQPREGEQVESLRPALSTMHRARKRQERLAGQLAEWVGALAAAVEGALTRGTPVLTALAEFLGSIEAFRGRAGAYGQDPDAMLAGVTSELPTLHQAFRSVIAAHTPPNAMAEVQALLAEGRYVDASERVARAVQREGVVLRTGSLTATNVTGFRASGGVSEVGSPDAARADAVPVPGIGIPERVRVHRARVWRQLVLDEAVLTMIVGAGITILGYYLYSPSFVGTGRELLTIFLWAFGLDVGAQVLVAQSARLSASGAAA